MIHTETTPREASKQNAGIQYKTEQKDLSLSKSSINTLIAKYHAITDALAFYRLGVMSFIIMVHGNIIAPVTLLAISYNSLSDLHFILLAFFSFTIVVSNIADRLPKETIPIFILSTLVNIGIILVNIL